MKKITIPRIIYSLILLSLLFTFASCESKKDYTLLLSKVQELENDVQLSSGSVKRFLINSEFVDARNIDVWVPQNYTPNKKYAVLYMHDGQMLYDASRSWNANEWTVDETITKLLADKTIQDVIVVGIWNNTHKRHLEYFPQKSIAYIAEPQQSILLGLMPEEPQGDKYLQFLVEEVKPFIDITYPTRSDRSHTFICGSSMGGLISLYALCEYPKVFGSAGCISTHWVGTYDKNDEVPAGINQYLKENLPKAGKHAIYFDYGSESLDAFYKDYQLQVDEIMKEKGYTNKNWKTLEFQGATHSEKDWSKRLNQPFEFLLKK